MINHAHKRWKQKEKLIKFIDSKGYSYIFQSDINFCICVVEKKKKICDKINKIDENNIIIVIKEIESWYLAGMKDDFCNNYKIQRFNNTDTITKEEFDDIIPEEFDSRIDFMAEMLKDFSINIAKKRNTSFRYFIEKYDC